MPMEFENLRSRERGANLPNPEVAFEHFADEQLEKLWRVRWVRVWTSRNGTVRKVECADYFATQDEAWQFVRKRTDNGDDVKRVDAFNLEFNLEATAQQPSEGNGQ